MMDPKTQDCLGHYLYGAGYYARDENSLAIVTGEKHPKHFCLSCAKRTECENEHERLVRDAQPEAAEIFDRKMQAGIGLGMGPTLAAVHLAQQGLDPFAAAAIENFKCGHADRGQKDGALIR